MIVGSGMAYTFLKTRDGMAIGSSIYDKDGAEIVPKLLEKAAAKGVKLHFPSDFVTADDFSETANVSAATAADGIPDGWEGLDCGPESQKTFGAAIRGAKTIVWNGPAGVFEFGPFQGGTKSMAAAVADATDSGATTIVGGGDTATAAKNFGVDTKVSHVSTGGGASLELLEGKVLPGVDALTDA